MTNPGQDDPLTADTIELLGVLSEVCGGTKWSKAVAKYVIAKLAVYGNTAVLYAINRCESEVKGTVALGHIIDRIPDGRPAVAIAYAQVSGSEADTFITTDEVLAAWGIARQTDGDKFAQRAAFDAAYKEICASNRINGVFPKQIVSIGHDKARAKAAIEAGVKQGLLEPTDPVAREYFPDAKPALPSGAPQPKQLPAPRHKAEYKTRVNREADIAAIVAGLAAKLEPVDEKKAAKLTAAEIQARLRSLEDLAARTPRSATLRVKING